MRRKVFEMSHVDEIRKSDDRCWGYAYVASRTEKRVAAFLENSGIPCYLPTQAHAYRMHSTRVVTRVPMFPGYLFLALGREEATDLRCRERRIRKVVLQFIPEAEMQLIEELNALKRMEMLAVNEPVQVNPGIVRGDRVEILSGPFSGVETDVLRRSDDRNMIVVNVSLLQQHVEFELPAWEVRKIGRMEK